MPAWNPALQQQLPPGGAGQRLVEFQVHGLPVGQGSKTYVPTPAGPRSKESNEKTLKPWRNDIRSAAYGQMSGYPPWTGPVSLRAVFIFPRPKTHLRTGKHAGEVKENAPGWKTSTPDLDKLLRALGDAMTGIVFRDDAQLVDIHAVKIYGQNPGVTVRLRAF